MSSTFSEFLEKWEEEEDSEDYDFEQEERREQMDDWIAEAQDCFFEGDYEKAIHYCEKALIENELDLDAKDILLMSLFSKSPSSLQSILDHQSKWRQNVDFNENLKDLFLELRASYLLNNAHNASQSAQSILHLLSQSNQSNYFNISLAIAILAELNHHDLANQFLEWFLPFYQAFPVPSPNSPEAEEWMKMRALLEWAIACDPKLMDHSVLSNQDVSTPSSFLSCIRILISMEKEDDMEKAVRLWNNVPSLQKEQDIHLQSISFLLKKSVNCPSSFVINDIVRKRLKMDQS
eukprot:TRINITY_DN7429_c0_g1_i1.p1 TRINITY_DN7429_c0_g1~~TRINITY_DN7429_c0_g1_i1.p1  ORF type:complete len:292 (-),score=89.91 TRINITY_DN7429_c0_g1_i1:208-1083(-)